MLLEAGGLATGSNAVKNEEDRVKFGGLANTILDPCYHQACDTIDNINQEVYLEMTQAAAYVLNVSSYNVFHYHQWNGLFMYRN